MKKLQKYLHESRHQHALKRARGEGGKFDSKNETVESTPNAKRQRSSSAISTASSSSDLNKTSKNSPLK